MKSLNADDCFQHHQTKKGESIDMLNVIGLVLAFVDVWLVATVFSITATAEDRTVLFIIIPLCTLATVTCFYFANRCGTSKLAK